MQTRKNHIFRLGISCTLVALMALAAAMVGGKAAYAANPACSTGTITTATGPGGAASCDATVPPLTLTGGSLGLSVTSDLTYTSPTSASSGTLTSNGSAQTVTFGFTASVADGSDSTGGWSLNASSTGMGIGLTPSTTYPIMLTGFSAAPTCATTTCNPAVPGPGWTPFTSPFSLNGVGGTIVTAVPQASGLQVQSLGTYTLPLTGSFTIPPDALLGTYTGTITLIATLQGV